MDLVASCNVTQLTTESMWLSQCGKYDIFWCLRSFRVACGRFPGLGFSQLFGRREIWERYRKVVDWCTGLCDSSVYATIYMFLSSIWSMLFSRQVYIVFSVTYACFPLTQQWQLHETLYLMIDYIPLLKPSCFWCTLLVLLLVDAQ